MKTQRFQNDEEYLAYVRKNAKDERMIYYTYVVFGIFMIAMIIDITIHALTKISLDIETLAVVAVLGTIGVYKLKKSGWLERQEDKTVEKAKIRLEMKRKKFAEIGMDVVIKKYEKDLKKVLQFGVYGIFGAVSLLFLRSTFHWETILIVIAISAAISTLFIKSKYFNKLVEKTMARGKQELSEGYLYNHVL